MVEDLNRIYQASPALWESDFADYGFKWIDCSDHQSSIMSFARRNEKHTDEIVVILNLTPVPRQKYRVGLPRPGRWKEILNSDAKIYGGSNIGNAGGVSSEDKKCHGLPHSAEFTLPPLGILAFQLEIPPDEPAQEKTEPEPEEGTESEPTNN